MRKKHAQDYRSRDRPIRAGKEAGEDGWDALSRKRLAADTNVNNLAREGNQRRKANNLRAAISAAPVKFYSRGRDALQ